MKLKLFEQRKKNYEKWKNLDCAYDFETNTNCNIENEQINLIKIAGRIVFFRFFGKIAFLKLQDFYGICQISIQMDDFPEIQHIKSALDLGDIIGVNGELYRTEAGEKTVRARKIMFLQKSLLPLPDKWSGIQDEELKIKNRYIELISNVKVQQTFKQRFKIFSAIRLFLIKRDFIEVETPILQTVPSGAAANPFKTFYDANKEEKYLRIAPELYLKRLIVAGMNKVFEIGKCFRNEGIDPTHLPEFTMLEFYQAYISYEDLQQMAIDLIQSIVKTISDDLIINNMDFRNIPKISYVNFIKQYGDLDFDKFSDSHYIESVAKKNNIDLFMHKSSQARIDAIYKHCCVKKIISPILVYDYPRSPLAKIKDTDNRFSQQFQIILQAQEIVKSCLEMNNAEIQEQNFKEQTLAQKEGDNDVVRTDNDFIEALKIAMPPCGGLGLGIDRITTILTESNNIRNVILFPMTKNKL